MFSNTGFAISTSWNGSRTLQVLQGELQDTQKYGQGLCPLGEIFTPYMDELRVLQPMLSDQYDAQASSVPLAGVEV